MSEPTRGLLDTSVVIDHDVIDPALLPDESAIAAIFSDGLPVTLRFADLTGEILTAGPTNVAAPLPFRFYI